jgi:hypothetical protein
MGDNPSMARQESGQSPGKHESETERRNARRAEALRENLRRRKQGERARDELRQAGQPNTRDP